MPVTYSGSSGDSKPKKTRKTEKKQSWLGRQVDDLVDIATGLPTATIDLMEATRGDNEALDRVIKGQVQGVKALGDKEEWKKHTALNLLTTAGLVAPVFKGGSAATAAARASKGGRVAAAKKVYKTPPSRKFSGVPTAPGRFPRRYDVPASPSPVGRALRAITLDPLYKASAKRATPTKANPQGRKGGGYAKAQEKRQRDKQTRYIHQSRGKEEPAPRDVGMVEGLWQAPNNLLRAGLPLNPRYYAQNLPSTLMMLLAQQGPHGVAKSAMDARWLAKNQPDVYKQVRDTMGNPAISSVGSGARGPLAKFARTTTRIGGVPESHMRSLALLKEARREGIPRDQMAALFRTPERSKFQKVASRGNEAVGDFSRLTPNELKFMGSGIPLFYSMNKALGRYAARFPGDHPTLTAALANMGTAGHEEQLEAFGGPLPDRSPYLIPLSGSRTLNQQNVLPYSPGSDILRGGKKIFERGVPEWNLGTMLGPSPEALYGLLTNRNLQSGWELDEADERSPVENALRETAPIVPGTNIAAMLGVPDAGTGLFERRSSKTYPDNSQLDAFKNWIAGRAFFPRETDYSELRRQADRGKKKSPF